jgi:hypothetical protein
VTGVLGSVQTLRQFSQLKMAAAPSAAQAARWQDALDVQLAPESQAWKDKLSSALSKSLHGYFAKFDLNKKAGDALTPAQKGYWSTPKAIEDSVKAIVDAIFSKAQDAAVKQTTEWAASQGITVDGNSVNSNLNAAVQALQENPGTQEAFLDAAMGKPDEVINREAKAAIAQLLARGYLEMVYGELSLMAANAHAGAPSGYADGVYDQVRGMVIRDWNLLNASRDVVGFGPGDEALKAFVDGSIASYKSWGKMAIALVTSGQALPALERVDVALDIGQTILRAARVIKGIEIMEASVTPGSDFWLAVERGVHRAVSPDTP